MKILVFSDFHGNLAAYRRAVDISVAERSDKTVLCGDLFGWSSDPQDVAALISSFEGTLYPIRGNNDGDAACSFLPELPDDNAIMYHFGRTLFFTHGDRYNALRIPPLLRQGDVLVHGHTHVGRLSVCNELYVVNVGSIARPRDGFEDYVVLDETGVSLKQSNGELLSALLWK